MDDRVINKQHIFNYELKHKAFLKKYIIINPKLFGFYDNNDEFDLDKLTLNLIDNLVRDKFFDTYRFEKNEVYDFISDYKDLIDIYSFMTTNVLFTRQNLEFIADTFKKQFDEDPILWKYVMDVFMTEYHDNRNVLMKYKDKFDWDLFNRCVFNHDALDYLKNKTICKYSSYFKIVDKIKDYVIKHLDEILFDN